MSVWEKTSPENSQKPGTVSKADVILGVPLSRICFVGPEEELKQTKNTNRAIFLHSLASGCA